MLDGNNFVKSGWIHGLKLYQFGSTKESTPRFLLLQHTKLWADGEV